MRARNIKPAFFLDDDILELEPLERIFFAGLWCASDGYGRLVNKPKQLKRTILPDDEFDAGRALKRMHEIGIVILYSINGIDLMQIAGFQRHQSPMMNEKNAGSQIPCPTGFTDKYGPKMKDAKGKYSIPIPHPIKDEYKTSTVPVQNGSCLSRDDVKILGCSDITIPDIKNHDNYDNPKYSPETLPHQTPAMSENSTHYFEACRHYQKPNVDKLYLARNETQAKTVETIDKWHAAGLMKIKPGYLAAAKCQVLTEYAYKNADAVIRACKASDFCRNNWPFSRAFKPKNVSQLIVGEYAQVSKEEAELGKTQKAYTTGMNRSQPR